MMAYCGSGLGERTTCVLGMPMMEVRRLVAER